MFSIADSKVPRCVAFDRGESPVGGQSDRALGVVPHQALDLGGIIREVGQIGEYGESFLCGDLVAGAAGPGFSACLVLERHYHPIPALLTVQPARVVAEVDRPLDHMWIFPRGCVGPR
jgi:hypothetical protein